VRMNQELSSAYRGIASRAVPLKNQLSSLWRKPSLPRAVQSLPAIGRRQADTAIAGLTRVTPVIIASKRTFASERFQDLDTALLLVCGYVLFRAMGELFGPGRTRGEIGKRHRRGDVAGLAAAREYDRDAQRFGEGSHVEASAREAEEALSGPEASDLKRAEEIGKRRSAGEDPHSKR
jgi:hypothetical protein